MVFLVTLGGVRHGVGFLGSAFSVWLNPVASGKFPPSLCLSLPICHIVRVVVKIKSKTRLSQQDRPCPF